MNPAHILLHLLSIVFVVLKLTNTIDWSWWYVTAPSWAPLALGATLYLLGVIVERVEYALMTDDERARHDAAKKLMLFAEAIKAGRA